MERSLILGEYSNLMHLFLEKEHTQSNALEFLAR
jgi:hypothetical protein